MVIVESEFVSEQSSVMPTPVSTGTAYATATDLIAYHDVRQIGDWCEDGGAILSPANIATDPNVATALLRASGEVEMACFAGGRYAPTDLQALTGASQAALKGLVCDLAFWHLGKRRIPDPSKIAGYKEAREMLDALREGKLIFGLQEVADAGVMDEIDIKLDSEGRLQRPSDIADRLFGQRMDDFRCG
jgi:phage gp36-like protein